MQSQKGSIDGLPEHFLFGGGSISDDPLVSTQAMRDNSSGTYGQSGPGYTLPSTGEPTVSLLENRCLSNKRKAVELNVGQSPDEGSSSNTPLQAESDGFVCNNTSLSEPPANSRHRLVIREAASSNPFSSPAPGDAESSRRNLRLNRNPPSRWSLAPRTRLGSSSSSETWGPPASSMNIPGNSMFPSSAEIESSPSQNPTFLNSADGSSSNLTAQTHTGTGLSSSDIDRSNGATALRPRRQTEAVRRPMLSSSGVESVSRSAAPELEILGRAVALAALESERHVNATRSGAMRENVWRIFDMLRRGEGIRLEDMRHGRRHPDMRMDVDNMSYEELLALEERAGNVRTGLGEKTITKHLRQQKYTSNNARDQGEAELCSICREEYNEGEDLGKLECGHYFHRECIKQWLTRKNLCPICRNPGLKT